MLMNYFITAFRNTHRRPGYTVSNVPGPGWSFKLPLQKSDPQRATEPPGGIV